MSVEARYEIPRCAPARRLRAGTAASPARSLACSPQPGEAGRGSDAALSKRGFPEIASSERGARASLPTPGRPLGNHRGHQGRAGLPTPHRPACRRSAVNVSRRRREARSVS